MRSLLLVDDHQSMRQIARALVEQSADWEVVAEATTGQQAIDAARAHAPDAILLDHSMPQMTGLEALPELRRLCPDAGIVMWSSESSVDRDAIAAGADRFLDKQATIEDLLPALAAAAAGRTSGP